MSNVFSIAHLSDLHLTAHPNDRRSEPKFKNRLAGMNAACRLVLNSPEVQDCDFVLITGDVTDKGDIAAWEGLNEMLVQARLKLRTLVIAGNHDVCGLGARFGWPQLLARADLDRVRLGLKVVGQPVRYPWAKVVDPRVVIFGLDSNNAGNWTAITNAIGRIGEKQLARFAELLAKHQGVPVKIIAVHHSPNIPKFATAIRRGRTPRPLQYRWSMQMDKSDRRTLRSLCVASKVRLIVHGHLHEAEDRRVNGVRFVGAPATTEPLRTGRASPHYQFYRYNVHGKGGRVTRELVEV